MIGKIQKNISRLRDIRGVDLFINYLNIFFSKFDSLVYRFPLIFSLVFGILSRFAFTDAEMSSCFLFLLFYYFRILKMLYLQGKTKRFFFSGLFYGFGIYSGVFYWILSLNEFGFKTIGTELFLSIFGYVGATLYLSFYIAISAYLARKLSFNILSLYIFFSCFVSFCELIARYVVDLAPFVFLSYGVSSFNYFIQIGSIVGTIGITLLVFLIISFLNVKGYRNKGLLIYFICVLYGFYKLKIKNDYLIPKEKFDICVVQANLDDDERSNFCDTSSDGFAELADIDSIKNLDHKLLVIAPETIIYSGFEYIKYFVKRGCGFYKNKYVLNPNRFTNIADDNTSNIIVCTGFWEYLVNERYNSYQFFTYDYASNDVKRLDYYDKKYLIPFGETIPNWMFKLTSIMPKKFKFIHDLMDEFRRTMYNVGKKSNTIRLNGISPFAMEICSDIINSGLSLDDSYEPTWILSTMNFHNFNGKDKVTNLAHLGFLFGKYRSLEFSRPVVMCINFGYSCIIDCNGNVVKIIKKKKSSAFKHEMPMKYDVSIFSMFRNKVVFFMLLMLLILLFIAKYKKNKSISNFFSHVE